MENKTPLLRLENAIVHSERAHESPGRPSCRRSWPSAVRELFTVEESPRGVFRGKKSLQWRLTILVNGKEPEPRKNEPS